MVAVVRLSDRGWCVAMSAADCTVPGGRRKDWVLPPPPPRPLTSPVFLGLSRLGVGLRSGPAESGYTGCQAAPKGADRGNRGGGVGVTGTPSPGSRKSRFKDWPDRLLST